MNEHAQTRQPWPCRFVFNDHRSPSTTGNAQAHVYVLINGDTYQVCSARTQAEHALGINNPHCKDGAMFYFHDEQRYIFNMVNVSYPLMLLTLDVNWKAQEVVKMAPEQLRIVPKKSFKFALELKEMNADVKIGDEVMYID
ncbi:DUF192 domain-containing protein [Alteromonas sp. a30]|uniref:DUF192 domain-containing protein n=1 Tax=Alteromonas sp. a30 TaxID=2730917 RepID=UPI00227EAD37|nr:DUF192 domain-containing protein [Alteromonas sp. a30]MCY7293812.1 DUF192 domain-containing protein [Alteromonas sp. a30]